MKVKISAVSAQILLAVVIVACGTAAPQEIAVENSFASCRQIVFSYGVHGRNHFEDNIVSTCPDGTNKVRLTVDGEGNLAPAWSPDGSEIAFISDRSGSQQLYVMDADDRNINQVTSGLAISSPIVWLLSGQHIALHVLQEGGSLDGLWSTQQRRKFLP